MQVNTTENALLALNNEMANKVKDLEDLDEWKKEEYIEMYKKLSAEMEEMKQIASPGVAMDVKTGKVITAGTVGLVQVKKHSPAKDLQRLHLLMKGTQSVAKQYMICMA